MIMRVWREATAGAKRGRALGIEGLIRLSKKECDLPLPVVAKTSKTMQVTGVWSFEKINLTSGNLAIGILRLTPGRQLRHLSKASLIA
jgi:hypothetical protein